MIVNNGILQEANMSEADKIFAIMRNLIADKLEIDEEKVTLDSSFTQDLGADSLDTYELMYAVEEELGVSIPDDIAVDLETVRQARDFILGQRAGH